MNVLTRISMFRWYEYNYVIVSVNEKRYFIKWEELVNESTYQR